MAVRLLVCTTLAETDFPDFGQQVLKVVLSQEGAVLHPLFIDDVATDGELAEHICTPLSELGGPDGVVVIDLFHTLGFVLGLEYEEFGGAVAYGEVLFHS